MKAQVFFETRHNQGHMIVDEPGIDFQAWCQKVGGARAGDAFLVTPKTSIPLRIITRIENLETE